MNELPRSVRWSGRAYRWLIRAYPVDHRREFGEPMVRLFTDMVTDAHRKKGLWGLVRAWFRVMGDLASSVLWEHYRSENRKPEMKATFYAVASVALAVVVQMLVMFAIGIVIVTVGLISAESVTGTRAQDVLELLLFFSPALLAAMILVHTKPFYRPWLTAPLGAMAFFAFAFLADTGTTWRVDVPFIAFGGFLSLAGCYLGSRNPHRRRKGESASLTGAVE